MKTGSFISTILLLIAFGATAARAAIVVTDGFNTQAIGALNGQGGGSGWIGNWNTQVGVNVSQGGLSYSNGAIHIDGGNQKLELNSTANGTTFREIPETSGTVYMSLLFRPAVAPDRNQDRLAFNLSDDTNINIISSGIELFPSDSSNSGFVSGYVHATGGFGYGTQGFQVLPNNTYFLVSKLSIRSPGNETNDFWFNPNSLDENSNTKSTANAIQPEFLRKYFTIGTSGLTFNGPDNYFIDELRIGTTWNDVVSTVPEPSGILLLAIGGTFASFRRCRRRSRSCWQTHLLDHAF
ncbi:MAG: PEP-CTERM sorting domain-containing protein [Planctomycetales bacterium]|nr:PEP-CTERM sorting domain-containing protein [Planctomycetales bacterium]